MTKKNKPALAVVPDTETKSDEEPKLSGLEVDALNLGAAVRTIRDTYKLSEGASVKIVDLAVSLQLTAMTLGSRQLPPLPDFGDGEKQDTAETSDPQE